MNDRNFGHLQVHDRNLGHFHPRMKYGRKKVQLPMGIERRAPASQGEILTSRPAYLIRYQKYLIIELPRTAISANK